MSKQVSNAKEVELSSDNKSMLWGSFFSKYLFEFFIVFLGVYLAFLFTDYQDAHRERQIRIKYYDSLIFEFEGFYQHLQSEESKLLKAMEVVKQIKAGNEPKIALMDFHYLYNGIAVRTAFNSQNFQAIDHGLLKSIIGGIYLLEKLEGNIERFNQFQMHALIPYLHEGKPMYDGNGQLAATLNWYPQLVEEIYNTNKLLQDIVRNRAIPDMKRGKDHLESLSVWQLPD